MYFPRKPREVMPQSLSRGVPRVFFAPNFASVNKPEDNQDVDLKAKAASDQRLFFTKVGVSHLRISPHRDLSWDFYDCSPSSNSRSKMFQVKPSAGASVFNHLWTSGPDAIKRLRRNLHVGTPGWRVWHLHPSLIFESKAPLGAPLYCVDAQPCPE